MDLTAIPPNPGLTKLLRIMNVTAVLLLVTCLQVSAKGYSQITLQEKNTPIEKVFEKIQDQSGYVFWYEDKLLEHAKPVDISVQNASLEKTLEQLFKDQPLNYSIVKNTIVIKAKPVTALETGDVLSNFFPPSPIDIHGRITDPEGEPLVGATIKITGSNTVAVTDGDGRFTLKGVDENASIEISYVGFVTQTIPVKNRANILLALKRSDSKLDEVQVIAYGTTSQRLSTSNISSVSAKEIEEQPVSNPLLTLEGRVTGVFITQTNGISGGGVTVKIQGQNSITKGNDPFYVIDGLPYVSQMLSTTTGGPRAVLGLSGSLGNGIQAGGNGNPFSYINPDDIESIEVLKDADATAIYGSRAANGAILITTKKGKAGLTKVNFNVQDGWGQVTRKLDLLNAQQYVQMRLGAKRNDNAAITTTDYDINGIWDQGRSTDWQKELIGGTAQYNDYNCTVSGGSENTQFLISGTFHRETTVFPGNFADQKGGLHFNINNVSSNKKFRIQLFGSYLTDNNQLPSLDLTNQAISLAPDAPALYKPDGTINWQPNSSGTSTWTNPLSYIYATYQNKTNSLLANSILSYKISSGLEVESNFGYTNLQTNEFSAFPLTTVAPESQPFAIRTANFTNSYISSWIAEPKVKYKIAFGKSKLDILVGMTIQQTHNNGSTLNGSGFNSDAVLQDIHSASTISIGATSISVYKYNGLFGRINYNWSDKYIVNLTARKDGSSRFGINNQFHNFGALGAAWIFSEENFIKNNFPILSFGKLRGSYGITGNDQIGDYQFLNLYSPITPTPGVPYQGAVGLSPNSLSNPYLQWEETRKLQFGVDLGFFKDRILLTTNYIHNRSSNQLLGYQLPIISGFASIPENFPATVQNNEWEFSLNSTNIKSNSFGWSTTFNLTIPKNKLVSFPNLATSTYSSALTIGQPLYIIKAFQFAGVDPAAGIYQFKDSKGNITSNPLSGTDNTVLINTLPKLYGGFQNSFRYKSFHLDVLFQFVKQIGVSSYYFGSGSLPPGFKLVNGPTSLLNAWQAPGDIAHIQRYSQALGIRTQYSAVRNSDAGYSDASYVRLKNLSLSYQLPEKLIKKAKIQNLKLYVQGQNLLTITKFQGLDPENQSGSGLPPLRVLTLGFQVGL